MDITKYFDDLNVSIEEEPNRVWIRYRLFGNLHTRFFNNEKEAREYANDLNFKDYELVLSYRAFNNFGKEAGRLMTVEWFKDNTIRHAFYYDETICEA